MKTRALQPRMGAHLWQVGLNHWTLVGPSAVTMRRLERDGVLRWDISCDNVVKGSWENLGAALAHAYALATGHSNI